MRRVSFVGLAAAAAFTGSLSRRTLATERIRGAVRLGRPDRSLLVGSAGACASLRSRNPLAGYVPGDLR